MEQHVVAFAEQVGRIVGTVQAKADGWLESSALSDQVARIRDSAATLLQRLRTQTEQKTERVVSGQRGRRKLTTAGERNASAGGRSGGVVDAPGKKHRKPSPRVPLRAAATDTNRLAKMKAVNSNRRRGRD